MAFKLGMPLGEALKQKYSLIRQLSFIIFVETLRLTNWKREDGRIYFLFT